MNKFVMIIVLAVVAVLGFMAISKPETETSQPVTDHTESPLSAQADDRYLSKAENSSVTLYEYSDFQCPACAAFYPMLNQVKDEYKDNVNFVFRHFPLTAIHPKAMSAHRIVEAAHAQGAFVEVHDLLFEQNQIWTQAPDANDSIYELIKTSGIELDIDQLKTDVASSDVSGVINAHIESGNAAGVNATPTFFLNDKKIEPRSVEDFKRFIDAALEDVEV